MRWFGRKAIADGLPGAMLEGGPRGFATWLGEGARAAWPQGYEAQVRALYLDNAIAQRAVRIVVDAVAAVPLQGAGETCALIGAASGGQVLLESVAQHLLLHGNAYVRLLGDGDGRLSELYVLRPERVTIEADARGWPVAIGYRVGAGPAVRYPFDDTRGRAALVQLKSAHPLDDHYGLGSLNAAAGPIATHNAATRWNKAMLDNAARPSGAMVVEGESLTAAEFARLRDELDTGFAGAANAGRPMLLEGGMRWQPLSLTPADMDFATLKAGAARDIALAFGVPPMLLGQAGDATYANYREANRALFRLTVLPLANAILRSLNAALATHGFGPASIALDHVPALSDEREALWAKVAGADFLSRAEKRALLGIGLGVGAKSIGEDGR